MANPSHLEKLREGPRAWNEWRAANPYVVPDLSDAALALNQRQFGPGNGGPIDLRAVNLKGAMLRFATLSEADLEGANLMGADLMHARLDGAKLIAADLTDAMLDHADLTQAKMARAVIIGASFMNARNLTQAQVDETYGDGSTLLPAYLMLPPAWFPDLHDDFPEFPARVPEDEPEDNLYYILGITPAAELDDIRTAYRNLVKKLHPDLNPDDKDAQDLFKKVSTAYRILSDADKRARYDKGEIDGEGRVRPEYEAKRAFRRYAFRFYAAAVMALLFAAGALAFVWQAVLHTGGQQTAATISAPKQTDRLLTGPQPKAQPVKTADESGRQPQPGQQEAIQPPGNSEAVKAANLEPATGGSQPVHHAGGESTAGPLGEPHREGEAGGTQAASAGPVAREGQKKEIVEAPDPQALGSDGAEEQAALHPKAGQEFVSSVLRSSAIKNALEKIPSQSPASTDGQARKDNELAEAKNANSASLHTGAISRRRQFQYKRAPVVRQGARRKRPMGSAGVANDPWDQSRDFDMEGWPGERHQAGSDALAGGM